MSNQNNQRLKIVSLVIVITLVGKLLGLGRNMLIGQNFGTGLEADALAAASLLPRIFFDAVFASAVSSSFIPVYSEVLERQGKAEAERLAGSFLTIVGLAAAGLTALGMLFSADLIGLAANFDPHTAALSARLLTIIFPSLFFTGLAFSMVGILNSHGEFNVPASMSIASNGILIVYFLFFVRRFGVYGAAVALLIGWAAQAAMQIPSLKKKSFRYRPGLRHPGLRKIFKLMLPVMVSTWIQPINMLIILQFASALPGGVSSLDLANGLFIIIAGIFVLSVTNVVFPEMSRLSLSGDRSAFRDIVRDTTRTLLFLLIPMTVGLMLLAAPLVRLLYEYRQFDAESTRLTSSALFFMSIGMVGYGIQNVLIRAFYAEKQGRVPLIAGLVSIAVNFTLCYLLVDAMGVAGLGLASAMSLLGATVILVPAAHRLLGGGLVTRRLLISCGKMGVSALAMGAMVYLLRNALADVLGGSVQARLLLVGGPVLLGIVVYFGFARLLRLEEMQIVTKFLRKKGGDPIA